MVEIVFLIPLLTGAVALFLPRNIGRAMLLLTGAAHLVLSVMITGTEAVRTTSSATDPRIQPLRPRRPWVPITIRSQPISSQQETIASAAAMAL